MANIANRLTIQIDLSGFSFKITDPSGEILNSGRKSFPSGVSSASELEDILKKELSSMSVLSKKYSQTDVVVETPTFTLVPASLYDKESEKQILSQIHKVEDMDEVMSIDLPEHEAKLIYAIPNSISSRIFKIQKKAKYTPIIYQMIKKVSEQKENNKVCIHFSKNHIHIVASERDRLLLANSFQASDFITAQYYIFFVIKEVMFNPEFTTLQIVGEIDKNQKKSLSKYFKGVNTISI